MEGELQSLMIGTVISTSTTLAPEPLRPGASVDMFMNRCIARSAGVAGRTRV